MGILRYGLGQTYLSVDIAIQTMTTIFVFLKAMRGHSLNTTMLYGTLNFAISFFFVLTSTLGSV